MEVPISQACHWCLQYSYGGVGGEFPGLRLVFVIYNTNNYPKITTGYQTTDTWLDWCAFHTVGGRMVPGSILLDCIFFPKMFFWVFLLFFG